jgi:hypothetical protein
MDALVEESPVVVVGLPSGAASGLTALPSKLGVIHAVDCPHVLEYG